MDVDINTLNPTTPKGIPIESILELYKKGLSERKIAKLLDCSNINIHNRLKAYKSEIQGIEPFKRNRADIFAIVQSKIINKISEKDIAKASLLQKATTIGILHDKEQKERGLIGDDSTKTVYQFIRNIKIQMEVGETRPEPIDISPDNDDSLPPMPLDDVKSDISNGIK